MQLLMTLRRDLPTDKLVDALGWLDLLGYERLTGEDCLTLLAAIARNGLAQKAYHHSKQRH